MSEKVNNPYFEHVFNVVRKNHTKQTFDEFYNNIHRSPRFNDEVKKQYISIVGKDNFDANQYADAFNERIINVPANATAYEKMAEDARNKAKEATQQAKATTAPTQPTDTIPTQPTDTIPTSEGKSPVDVSKLATASMSVSTKRKEEDSGNWWVNTGRKFMSSLANIGTSMVDNILRFGAAQARYDVGYYAPDNMDMINRIMDTMIDDINQDKLGYQQFNTALQEKVEEADKTYYGVNAEGESKGFMDLMKDGKVVKALQKGVSEGLGSMPTSLVAMIPYVGTSIVAVSSMNDKYKELKQNNPEMGEMAMTTNAVITGAIEGLSERIGKSPILKELAIFKNPNTRDAFGDLLSELGTRAFARTFGRFLKSQGKEALGEGLEEVVSASGEMLVDFTTGKERDYSINDIADSFVYGAFGGAIGGKSMELGGKAVMYRGLSQERKERVRATYKNNTEFRNKVESYISQYNDFVVENQQVFGDANKSAEFNTLCEDYISGIKDYDTFKRDAIAMGIKPSSDLNDNIAMGSVFDNLDLIQEGSTAGIHSWFASVQEGNKAKTKEGKTTKKLTELSSLIHQYYASQDVTQVGNANSDIALFMSRNNMTQEQFADMLINGGKKDQAIFFDFIDKQIKNRQAERDVIQGVMNRNGIDKDTLLGIVERGLRGEELGETEAKIFDDYKEASANFASKYQKGFFLDNYAQYANEFIKGLVNPETGNVETALYDGKRVNVVSGKVNVVVNSNGDVKMTTNNPDGTVGIETIYNTKAEAKATGKKYKKVPGGKYAVYKTVNVNDLTFVDSNTQAEAVANAVVSLDEAMTAQDRFKVDDVVVDAENNIGVVSEIDDRGNVSIESEDGTRLRLKGRDAKDKIQSVKFEPGQTFGEFTITKVNEDGSIIATDAKGESAIFGSKMELATFLADTGTGLYTPTTNDMEQIQDATGQNEQQIDESINAPQQAQENAPNEVVEDVAQEGEQGDNFYVDENGNKVYSNDDGQGDNFYVDENGNKVYFDTPTEVTPTDSNTENTPIDTTPTEPTPTEPTREEVEEANATESQSKRTKETLQEDKAKAKETERKTNENIQRQMDSDAEAYNAKRRKEKERMIAIAFNTLRISLPKVVKDIKILYAEDVKEGHPCYEPLRMYGSSFKGMYSHEDGKVYIIADNCVSSTDMIETIMHEYVIHQGLRETMSEEDYTDLCYQIFDSMSESNKSLMVQYCRVKLPVKTDAEGNAMTLPNGLPIYDYSDIAPSEVNAIADEYMAHYAEDSSVLAVEDGVVSKIIDAIRNKVFKHKSFRSAEKLVKQMYNQRHYRLKSVQRDIANEQNNGTITNDRDSRYSVEAIVQGCGFDIREDDGDGNMALVCNVGGKEKVFSSANHITPQDVKNNVGNSFSFMVAQAISNGTIPAEKMDVYYQKYCDMLNLFLDKGAAENGGYSTVADEYRFWNTETVARSVSTNSDSQYLQSIDIARICRKNEAVINAISELQVRNGYGILPTQILDIYNATKEGGFDVPCPVCYVFSRYIRNGIFADSIISGMEEFKNDVKDVSKMNDKEKEEYARFWIKKREEYHKRDKKIAKSLPSNTDDLYIILQQMDALTKKLTVSKITEQERATLMQALNVLQNKYQEVLKIRHNRKLYTFIDKFIITTAKSKGINIDGQYYNLREDAYFVDKIDDYKRHALDLRLSPVTPSLYPAICRVRNSGGSSAGKSIQYASNNTLGEVISGLSVAKPEDSRKNPFTTEEFKSGNTGDAAKQITTATNNVKAQNLRGGVRIFSWSDHMRSLAPDEFMNMIQLNIIGGGVQSYSKQLDGVQLIASCGAYVNGSLIAFKDGFEEVPADDVYEFEGKKYSRKHETNIVDNNGNTIIERSPVYEDDGKYYTLIFDENVGIKANSSIKNGVIQPGIFEMNKRLDKAGNIMVGMNEKHIKMCLQDPRILFIIPYHKSGMNNHIFKGFMQIVGSDSDIKAEDYTNAQSDIKFSDLQPKSRPRCYQVWQSHNYESKYKCGIEGGVKSDNPKGLTKTQKQYKALRDKIILRENLTEEEMTIISNDEFLSQVYNQITDSDATMSKDDKDAIYPYEYWDYNSTIETADVNGERYLEYCRRLGFAPKFSGVYAKKSKKGKNEEDVEVEVEEVDLTSNKGYFIDEPGYWKVLIDRRMYDTNGNYQSVTPVDITNFDVNTLSSAWNQEQFGDSYELKDADVQSIADAVENQWQNERVYDTYTFNYGADPIEALNNWKKYNSEWESLLKKNPEIKTLLDNHNVKTKVSAEEVDNVRSSMDALLNNGNSNNKNVLEDNAIRPELQEARFRIGNKRREDKRKTIVNKLSLMDDATYDAQIDYINELSESYKPNGGSTKLESCCLHWLEKGTLRLPEDNYKVLDAMKVLDRFSNIDGTQYNNPLDIVEQYSDRIKADTKTNPDDIKEFTDKKVSHNGVVVSYEVEDSKEGQKKVRQIVDEHWGKDANPWCLIQAQDGELTENSWRMWNHYNAYPKRIYFVNGELKYFSANDEYKAVYWNREDEPQSSLSYKNANGDLVSYYDDNCTLLKSIVRKDGTTTEYYENGQIKYDKDSEGNEKRYYDNGQLKSEKDSKLNEKRYYENGQLASESDSEGNYKIWYENGQLKIEDSEGNEKYYYYNGQLEIERDSKGNEKYYYENGQLAYEKDSEGNRKKWYENGNLKYEEDSEGNYKEYQENGLLAYEEDSEGNKKFYDKDGNLKPDDGTIRFRLVDQDAIKEEEDAIIAKAKANGTYMKAPNGNPTNLNEKQWVQVRTTNFKNWFGDWENDPENASKIVDENGEPKVVFHGTNADFNIFKKSDIPNGGYWFSNNPIVAGSYQDNILNINTFDDLIKLFNKLGINYDIDTIEKYDVDRTEEYKKEAESIREKYKDAFKNSNKNRRQDIAERNKLLKELDLKYAKNKRVVREVSYRSLNYDGSTTILNEEMIPDAFKSGNILKDLITNLTQNNYYDILNRNIDNNLKQYFLNIRDITYVPGNQQIWRNIYGQKTRDIVANAFKHNRDGVLISDILDLGPNISVNTLSESDDNLKNYYADVFVAFNPNQIKSATDNIGTFDPTDADVRYRRDIDANRGYTQRENGTYISNRASYAEEQGRFTKGTFAKNYGVSNKAFDALEKLGVIYASEWHHTGKNFNKSNFYSWQDNGTMVDGKYISYENGEALEGSVADKYAKNKKEIDKLAKEFEGKEWEYKRPKPYLYSIPSFDNYANEQVPYSAYKLTEEEENRKETEHNLISKRGREDEWYLPRERRYDHLAVDEKYREIEKERKAQWKEEHRAELEQSYNNEYSNKIDANNKVDAENSTIDEYNQQTNGKEKVLERIAEILGVSPNLKEISTKEQIDIETNRRMEQERMLAQQVREEMSKRREELNKWVDTQIKKGNITTFERVSKNDLPQHSAITKTEMNGKYGWFEASTTYNLPEYYSGYSFKNKSWLDKYNEKRKSANDFYAIRQELASQYDVNTTANTISESDDTMYRIREDEPPTNNPTDADIRYRIVKDKKIIDAFNKAEKITTYRAMVLHNGKLYPVMNTGSKDMPYEGGVKEGDVIVTDTPDESVMRQVEKDYEDGKLPLNSNGEYVVPNTQDKLIFNPSSSQRWYYLLVKDQGSPVPAAFNPYIHSSSSPLNDQFKSAWQRDNIVTVEMEITLDDIDGSGNSFYGAKDNVGSVDWNAGVLQNALTKTRQVYLSKYGKVKGIVPDSKVAEIISSQLNDTFRTLPSNVFTPSVRDELSKLGYTFETTNSSGIITEGVNKGKSWNDLYKPNRLTSKDGKDFGLYYPDGNILFNDNIDIFNTKASDVFPLFLNIFKKQFGDVYSEVKDKMMLNTKDNNIRQNIFENARKNDDKILNAIKNRDNAPESIQEGVDLFNSTMANFFNVDEFNIDNSLAEIQNKERAVSSPVSSFDNNADMDAKLKKDGVRFRRNINAYQLIWNIPQGKQDGFEWMKDYAIWRKSMIDNGYYKETDLPLFPSKNLSKMSFEDYVETSKQIKEWIIQAQFVDDYVQEMRRNERITRKFITGVADNCFALKNFYDFFRKQEECVYDVETMNAYEDSFRRGRRAQNHILDFTNNYERALLENVSSILKSGKLKDIELYWNGFKAITNKDNINGKRLTEREVLELYMQCKDMLEAQQMGLPDRGIAGFYNNIRGSFDTISDFVQAVEDRIGDNDVKLFWGNVNKCTKWSLELMNKYGTIDKDEYLELMKRNYYVPERGWKERDFEERELGYTGRNGGEYSPYNPALVRAKGRESLASSPLVYIRSIAHSTALYVEKERTKQCMLNFVKANEGLGLATGAFHFKRMYFVSVKDEYGNVQMQDGKPVIIMTETAPTKEMYDEDEKIKEQISHLRDRLVEAQEGYDAALKYKKANDLARYDSLITDLNNEIEELRKQRNVYKYVNDSDIIERTKSEKGQHSVIVHSEGFTYYLEFKDERIANILNGNLGRNESNIKEAIKKAGIERVTRFLASLKTQYSPVFALRNLARDGSFAHIMNLVKYGPRTASQQTMQMFYNMPLVASYIVNKGDLSKVDGKYKTYLEEFVEGGAQTGFSFTKPISQLNEDLNKDLDDIARLNTSNSELGWKDIAVKYINLISKEKAPKVFSAMSEISEMMVRFGQYVAMREKGLGVNESITEAKEVTVNFDRRGQLGNMLGGLYYFMNATIQGTVNIFNAAWHNPKRAAKIGGVGLMAMVLGFLNTLMNPDDPEDDVLWGEYDRNTNVVFKVGGLNVKLPLPHFFRIFWAAGVNVAQFQNNNKSATEAVTDAITFALDDIIPTSVLSVQSLIGYNEIEDAVVFNEWENYVHNVSPSLIQPAVDVVMNRDFLGNPIGRRPFTVNDEDRLAENLLYRKGANEYTIAACNWIRDITGGDSKNKYKDPGLRGIDINPSKVEYFIRSYFSGAPTDLVGVFDFMTKCIDTEYDVTPSDVPILKSFTKDYNQDKAYNMMYYTLEQRIDFLDKYYRESRKAGTKVYYEEGTTNYTDEYKRFLRAKRILRSKKRPTFDNNKPYKTEDIVDLMEAVYILNGSDY